LIQAAVLGSPISHSLSPLIHSAAYKILGIEGKYSSHEVKAEELSIFLASHHEGWTGFSLTMPLKEEALSCATFLDPLVERISSANTLINESGKWHAYSTDVLGFKNALRAYGVSLPQKVLIIGAGGTARAVAAALDETGTAITVMSRNSLRESAMRKSIQNSRIEFIPWGDSREIIESSLVVNTTPAGAADSLCKHLNQKPQGVLFDVLYKPWPTELARYWGEKVIPGIELLIYQGIEQVSLMTKAEFDHEELAEQLRLVVK
jgi:shikimate dehydrogenase